MAKVGQVFEIPLSGQKKAFGQFLRKDKMGPMIQVFNLISKDTPEINVILNSDQMFPPIFTGVTAALRNGFWKALVVTQVKYFEYPGFISNFHNEKTGTAGIWFYWNGEKSIRLGNELPEKYKNKEYLMVWDPHDVVLRIETGEYPFPYKDLIRNNKYTPRE